MAPLGVSKTRGLKSRALVFKQLHKEDPPQFMETARLGASISFEAPLSGSTQTSDHAVPILAPSL